MWPWKRRASERRDLLVVAGEASGDRAAAAVIAKLADVRSYGMGGLALGHAGTEITVDFRALSALGVGDVVTRARPVARAYRALVGTIGQYQPKVALLVNFTEFNRRLARELKRKGVRVVWYIAPQIWAWRPERARGFAGLVDRMAVILPFEEALWRNHGIDATYVGHPLRETNQLSREHARRLLDLTPLAHAVAIMPGSRPQETSRLLSVMLAAYERVRRDRASLDARVLLAASLDGDTRNRLLAMARELRVPVHPIGAESGAIEVLSAFDASFCCSGTASLEAAVAGANPIIAYRTDLATEIAARLFLRTAHVGLPNILLQRRAFPELLQRDATPTRLAAALGQLLDHPAESRAACDEVRAALGSNHQPSSEVAAMVREQLA